MLVIVALAWIYVAGMAALAEALSPQGTVLGAFFTFALYGALPLGIVLYLMATPARKRALRRAAALAGDGAAAPATAADAAASPAAPLPGAASSALDPDRRGHAPAGTATAPVTPVTPVPPKREEA